MREMAKAAEALVEISAYEVETVVVDAEIEVEVAAPEVTDTP